MESKINLSQVKPINYRVTASLVNQFIISTTQFLNRFGTRCDLKLRQVEENMHRINTTLNILEAKLGSIPPSAAADNQSVQTPAAPSAAQPAAQPQPAQTPNTIDQTQTPAQAISTDQPSVVTPQAEAAPAPVVEQGPKLKDDPRYGRYFKMVRMGVPPPAVKVKMSAEGFDPSVLDQDPEGPAPPGAPPPAASSDEEPDSEESDAGYSTD
mmetsp:Transcript_3147/g.6337  ORF Transcript_3147/g.6337 Transcript_3147/m.6337 type:complete len:211 (+) Transcript_3147:307-939(+)|eukprot:CAMPEP_0181314598 /NCGR_PEP_ID=MMETSP1101-20121128/14908_1 /TAXON_ID=46948 /ORGANISM="Rhodomonas abbreviata, Strain Caron Lab Isolate" /LENGTH=210 /DNA_ID=CAMNT_0023421711 /DNA_START=293 /DNA_END=925 /DNA_ORIENTATION=+